MNDPSVTEPVTKRADQLVVGDRIAAEYLPHTFYRSPGEVLYVRVHELTGQRGSWVFVAYILDDGTCESTNFTPNAELLVRPAADRTGQGYSREADDPTPVSPARVPLHTGGMTEGGLVDETDAVSCQGAPIWLEAACGRPGPHGPHGPIPPSEEERAQS